MHKQFRIFILTGLASLIQGQTLTGPSIIQRVDHLMNPQTSHAVMRMTIVTSSGQERVFIYESWSKNKGEKNLIRYLEPGRVKNQAILMLNNADDIWMYFPRTRRVRKMATHAKKQKLEGSDFNYEDMGAGDSFIKDYTAKRLDDEILEDQLCYRVELCAKPDENLSYSRLIFWVRQDNFVPVKVQYYDETQSSRLVKTLIQSDIKDIEGIPTAMKLVMVNNTDNTETRMEMLEISYNKTLDDALFSERGMKQ